MKARIDRRSGTGHRERIHFIIECSDKPVTKEEAEKAQWDLGYPPPGYGFYGFECVDDVSGTFTARWQCWASCD